MWLRDRTANFATATNTLSLWHSPSLSHIVSSLSLSLSLELSVCGSKHEIYRILTRGETAISGLFSNSPSDSLGSRGHGKNFERFPGSHDISGIKIDVLLIVL